VDLRRVVQVWARQPDGADKVGSGYLLSGSAVLTARHAVGDAADRDVLVQSHVLMQSHDGSEWTSLVERLNVSARRPAPRSPPRLAPPSPGGRRRGTPGFSRSQGAQGMGWLLLRAAKQTGGASGVMSQRGAPFWARR